MTGEKVLFILIGCSLVVHASDDLKRARNAAMAERLLVGCYGDDDEAPDFRHRLWSSSENTGYRCTDACRQQGFLYAATSGADCRCGDNVYRRYGESEDCHLPCPGNPLESCGGPRANSVYKVPLDIRYQGCFADDDDDRDLPQLLWTSSEGRSPSQCMLECSKEDFLYAGVQEGGDCYCGNQYGKHGQPIGGEMRCNSTCLGGWSEQNCGGTLANAVYSTGLAVHFRDVGGADSGLQSLYDDSPSFTGIPLNLFTSYPNLKSIISPRVVLHATQTVQAPAEDPICAGNCYTPCGEIYRPDGLTQTSNDIVIRAFYLDLDRLEDYVGSNPQRVYVYAQTVIIDKDINVPFTLLVRARQIIINRQTASFLTVSTEAPLLDIDIDEARHVGPENNLLFQKQSFMCARIMYETQDQEDMNRAWAITGDILSDQTFIPEQHAWVNALKTFRAYLTGIQREEISFVPFYSKNYFRQILENYYNQLTLYNEKFTRINDALTSDTDFVSFVEDMLKIQSGTNIAEARTSFDAAVNSVTRSKNTHNRIRNEFTVSLLDLQYKIQDFIEEIIEEIIGSFLRGLLGLVKNIINLCLGIFNDQNPDQIESDLREVVPEVIGLAEILTELSATNVELESFIDTSDELVAILNDEEAIVNFNFERFLGTIEFTSRLQVNVVRWQNLYNRVETVLSSGMLSGLSSTRPLMLTMMQICTWGEAQVRSMVEHAESLRDAVYKYFAWRSKVEQQDRYQDYLDNLKQDLANRGGMLAAMAEQTYDMRLDLNEVLQSFCQSFFYENLHPCNDLYRPEFGGSMYDLLMKINLARYDAILQQDPGSTVERILTIKDVDSDPDCVDPDLCPVNYFRNNKVLYWRVPINNSDLVDLDKYHVGEIIIEVDGAKVDPQTNNPWLKLLIESSGVFQAKYGGESYSFLTRAMSQSYEYNIITGHKSIRADIHQTVRFVVQHITPYTTWVIRVAKERSGDIDLSEVSQIHVHFAGSAVEPPFF